MGISLVTLALAKKSTKKAIDTAAAQAVFDAVTQSKKYTDDKISEIVSFRIIIVNELPPLETADPHVIYFVPRTNPTGEADFYYEYMIIDHKWEVIGSTELDLSNYWTIDETKAYIESKEYILPKATKTTLGGVKIDGDSILINSEGVISISDSYLKEVSGDETQKLIDENFDIISNDEISNLFP